jgi:hypothetical protein
MTINSITMGDYDLPLKVQKFVKALFAGMQQLVRDDIMQLHFVQSDVLMVSGTLAVS